MFIIIVFWLGSDRPSGLRLFVPALLLSILTLLFLPYSSVSLFHSCCSHARVFGKTLVHEFHISYSNTEWYLLFRTVQLYECTFCIWSEKLETLVNLNSKLNSILVITLLLTHYDSFSHRYSLSSALLWVRYEVLKHQNHVEYYKFIIGNQIL